MKSETYQKVKKRIILKKAKSEKWKEKNVKIIKNAKKSK